MPPRDPGKIQLDFPLLVADLIEQLGLVGTVGLLDFAPTVIPVFIVGDRDLSVDAVSPVFASTQIFQGFSAAPLNNAVIVDSGQLPAGTYDIFGAISSKAVGTSAAQILLEHRNAANDATLAVLLSVVFTSVIADVHANLAPMGYVIAEDERLRVANIGGVNATGPVAATIGARIRPIP